MAKLLPLVLVLIAYSANAQDYEWSSPEPYHQAVCKVVAGGSRGSGCYVQTGHFRFVLTAAHVTTGSGQATVVFQNGTKATGRTMVDRGYRDRGYDVGAVLVEVEGIEPLPLYTGSITRQMEICGFGGPLRDFRHFTVNVTGRSATRIETDGDVINGDSGGPWLIDGKVAGISSTGFGPLGKVASLSGGEPYVIYNAATSTKTSIIRDFADRLHTQQCVADS
jgi:hypothetical protein